MRAMTTSVLAFFCISMGGCGISLPQPDLIHPVDVYSDYNRDFDNFVRSIANHVVCEVRYAVDTTYISDPTDPRYILKGWAAKVELDLNATETGDFNPGLSTFSRTMDFALGINGKLQSEGINNSSLTYYIPFNQIMSSGAHTPDRQWAYKCDKPSDEFKQPIEGTLGIQSILAAGIGLYDESGLLGQNLKSGPFDTISKTVSFQATMSGNLNPVWKLTNVSLITPGPLAQVSRVSMNKLIITMGPNALGTNTELSVRKRTGAATRPVPIGASALDESFFLERLKGALMTR